MQLFSSPVADHSLSLKQAKYLRFSSSHKSVDFNDLKSELSDVVTFTSPSNLPKSPLKTGRQKLRRFRNAAIATFAVPFIGGGATWGLLHQHHQTAPAQSVIQAHDQLTPHWNVMREGFTQGRYTQPGGAVTLTDEFRLLMETLIPLLADNQAPSDLVSDLQRLNDSLPSSLAASVAQSITRELITTLEGGGIDINQASQLEIAKALNKVGFNPEGNTVIPLPDRLKQAIIRETEALQADKLVKSQLAIAIRDHVRLELPSHIEVSADKLQHIDTLPESEQPEALFKAILENTDNYRTLSPKQRQALEAHGTAILDALHADLGNPGLLVAAAVLGLLSTVGTVGLLAFNVKAFTQFFSARHELMAALKSDELFVQYSDLHNPGIKSQHDALSDSIWFSTQELARIATAHAKGKDAITDHSEVIHVFAQKAKEQLSKNVLRKIVLFPDSLQFLKAMQTEIDRAFEDGSYQTIVGNLDGEGEAAVLEAKTVQSIIGAFVELSSVANDNMELFEQYTKQLDPIIRGLESLKEQRKNISLPKDSLQLQDIERNETLRRAELEKLRELRQQTKENDVTVKQARQKLQHRLGENLQKLNQAGIQNKANQIHEKVKTLNAAYEAFENQVSEQEAKLKALGELSALVPE